MPGTANSVPYQPGGLVTLAPDSEQKYVVELVEISRQIKVAMRCWALHVLAYMGGLSGLSKVSMLFLTTMTPYRYLGTYIPEVLRQRLYV